MDRRHVDDSATTALFDHLFGRKLGAEKRALKVDLQHFIVLGFGSVENRGAGFNSRIVYHDVDTPKPFDRRGKETFAALQFADVRLDAEDAYSQSSDLFFNRVCRIRMRDVIDHNTCTLLCELERNRFADTAIAASNNGNFVCQ